MNPIYLDRNKDFYYLNKEAKEDYELKNIHLETLNALVASSENGSYNSGYQSLIMVLGVTRQPLQARIRKLERLGYVYRAVRGNVIEIKIIRGAKGMDDDLTKFLPEETINTNESTKSSETSTCDSNYKLINNNFINNKTLNTISQLSLRQDDELDDLSGGLELGVHSVLKPTNPPPDFAPENVLEFIKASDPKEITSIFSKTVNEKIKKGDYDKITAQNAYDYFRDAYFRKYRKMYTISSAQTKQVFGMIKNGPFKKYGKKETLEIIDNILNYYDSSGLSSPTYPRPTIYSITQDWLINKINDHSSRLNKELADYAPIADGPFEKMDVTSNLEIYQKVESSHWAMRTLAEHGYLPNLEVDEIYIEEVAIPLWNERNPIEWTL